MSVIITAGYTAAATYPLNHARIGYQNWLAGLSASAVTVTSELPGSPKDAPLRPDTFESWKPSAAGTWTVDLGTARAVNYAGLVGQLKSVSVLVEYSTNNSTWSTFATSTTQADDSPIMLLDVTRTARYWRVTLGASASLAVVYLGTVLEVMRPFYDGHSPLPLSRQTELRGAISRGGQFIAQDIIKRGFAGDVSWSNLTPAWYRTNFDPLVKHLRTLPAFFAWNCLTYSQDIVYCWSTGDIKPVGVASTVGGRMSVSISLQGVGNRD
jgi:hypothetical protein